MRKNNVLLVVLVIALFSTSFLAGCDNKGKAILFKEAAEEPTPFDTVADRPVPAKPDAPEGSDVHAPNPRVWNLHTTALSDEELAAFAASEHGEVAIAGIAKQFGGWNGSKPYSVEEVDGGFIITYRKECKEGKTKELVVQVIDGKFEVVEKPHSIE